MRACPTDHSPSAPLLEITVSVAARRMLRLRGEVDCATAPALRNALCGCAGPPEGDVLVDLGGVTFLSAAGLAVLVEAHQRTAEQGDRLLLVRPSRMHRRIFTIVGLDEVLVVVEA